MAREDDSSLFLTRTSSMASSGLYSLKRSQFRGHHRLTGLPFPRFPNEIVDRIIEFYIETLSVLPLLNSANVIFAHIKSLSLASHDFRVITLRRFFRDILVETDIQWEALFRLLMTLQQSSEKFGESGGFAWVRSLRSSSKLLSEKSYLLFFLTQLQMLSIDFAREGLVTQGLRLKTLFQDEELEDLTNLTSLTLTNVPRIDVHLLLYISKIFPLLTDLYLNSTARLDLNCCWNCFEDSLTCTIHSPIPEKYSNARELARAFADALKPLKDLAHLHLGIFLCSEELIYWHVGHSMGDDNFEMPGCQCIACLPMAKEAHERELAASLIIAQKLKALKRIGWSTFHGVIQATYEKDGIVGKIQLEDSCWEERILTSDRRIACSQTTDRSANGDEGGSSMRDQKYDMSTTIWILRENGRLRVRKKPWN